MNVPMLTSNHYLGSNGKAYSDRQQPAESAAYKFQSEFFKPFIRASDYVLDFGCGKGGLARNLKSAKIDGFDVNPEVLAIARECYSQTFGRYADLLESFYDVVVSNHCLEHTLSPLSTLESVLRCLKPNGLAVFVVPHDCITRQQTRFAGVDRNHHLYTWTPRTLANLFKESGFQVQQCSVLRISYLPRLARLQCVPYLGLLSTRILCHLLRRVQVLCVARKPPLL